MDMEIQKLLDLLRGHSVYIQTHNFPDPDAIGSAFGLQQFLDYYGIKSTLCYVGNIERLSLQSMISLLPIHFASEEELQRMTSKDSIVTVDGQKQNANLTDLPGSEVACIDHHPTRFEIQYQYKDVRILGSCSTMIAEYYLRTHTPITTEAATALLYGLEIDTDNLNRGVTNLDIDMFSYLYKHADHNILRTINSNTLELNDLKAYGAAIENIHLYGRTGFANIPFECPDALIAMVADFILSLQEVDFCVIYSTRDNYLKFSTRSSCPDILNAGVLTAQSLSKLGGSGGGHSTMAGGILSCERLAASGAPRDHWPGLIESAFEHQILTAKGLPPCLSRRRVGAMDELI